METQRKIFRREKNRLVSVFLLSIEESSVVIDRQDQTTLLLPFSDLLSGDGDAKNGDQLVFSPSSSPSSPCFLDSARPVSIDKTCLAIPYPKIQSETREAQSLYTDGFWLTARSERTVTLFSCCP